jgi:HSP20 family molecular chaperone IbpA/uncharacterized membrane protein
MSLSISRKTGVSGSKEKAMAKVERSIEVNVPLRVAYEKLNQFEEFPKFMKGVHSVHQLDDAHLHWRAEKDGHEMEWDAEITENIPEKCIAWRNTSGPHNEGRVEFEALEPNKTRISLHMDADEASLRHPYSIYAESPQDEGDLGRFKKMLESQVQGSATSFGGSTMADAFGMSGAHGTTETRTATGSAGSTSSAGASKTGMGSERAARQATGQTQQVWDDPIRIMRKMGEEMEQFLGRWIGPGMSVRRGMLPLARTRGEWTPPVDIEQFDGQLHICADLPGVSKNDVQIEIVRGQLLIEGERRGALGQHRQTHRLAECNHGHFYRSIPLPEGVDPDSAQASMHDGVLDITLQIGAVPNDARRLNIQG